MGRTIFKIPDQDLYIEWGSVTESPTGWGTREQMIQMLIDAAMEQARYDAERRVAAADDHGSSAFPMRTPDSMMFQQKGTLRTEHLLPFVASYNPEDGTYDESWIDPLSMDGFSDRRVGRAEQYGPFKIEVSDAADQQ